MSMQIIPIPKKTIIKSNEGFTLNSVNYYSIKNSIDKSLEVKIQRLLLELGELYGARWVNKKLYRKQSDAIFTEIVFEYDKKLMEDEYILDFDLVNNIPKKGLIILKFSDFPGIANAFSSIYQIQMQDEFFPIGQIKDSPKFKWRGTVIDISRHFFNIDELKKMIFIQWLYKQNIMHLHMTDDHGWRIEIKNHLEVSERANFRYKKSITRGTYGGHIRQSQIKEFIDFAKIFNIEIMPEIDLPGHNQPLIYTYPELLCEGEEANQIMQINGISEQVICMSNPKSLTILKSILSEIADIFPFEYIHIGGDEAPLNNAKKCGRCQKYIKENKLKSEADLQKRFVKELIGYLKKKSKKVMAWEDLIEEERIEGLTISYWRGWALRKNPEDMNDLAEEGYPLLYNNSDYLYIQKGQTATDWKRGMSGSMIITLKDIYEFNPFEYLKPTNQKSLMGSEVSLWTEEIRSFSELTFKWLPRMIAAQEVLWGTSTSYDDFIKRLKQNIKILDTLNIQYGSIEK